MQLSAHRIEKYLAFAPALLETYCAHLYGAEDVSPGPAMLHTKSLRSVLGQRPIAMDTAIAHLPQDGLPLEQQVARLQALLEATRQVHSTMQVKEVLVQAARILVRELEMEGALFLSPAPVACCNLGPCPKSAL